ncbi:hypothetical protein CLV84_1955 [Neolewinella xylanilytica]|uniref:Transmembrane protein n=1 Tax=Neolewinella xylanilytica TaxID=1514080 RepID=A0A2S6I1L1_9BACT|nr:hypothetical protein [Neolewinella xylanilytica]PPK85065.1 hypothetical protein CLV84_1955 [Neolewinella xylanilytica]
MRLINSYYERSPTARHRFQVKLALFALVPNLIISGGLYWLSPGLLVLSVLLIALTLTVVAPFFDVPGLVERGKLTYYSALLLGEEPKHGRMIIHGGTLFDYYFTLDQAAPGHDRTRQVLADHLRGLLALIQAHDDDLTIRGTSYIIGERTAVRIGLKKVPTDFVPYLILLFNYVNLMFAMRLVKGRWELPVLGRVHTFSGRVGDVRRRAAYLQSLLQRLESRT